MTYPDNSTAKVYHNQEGDPVTLRHLIKHEPEWAHSRIKVCEALEAKLSACKELANSFTKDGLRLIEGGKKEAGDLVILAATDLHNILDGT